MTKAFRNLLKIILGIFTGLLAGVLMMSFWAFIRSLMEDPIYVKVIAGTPLLNIVLIIANAAVLILFIGLFLLFRKLKPDSSLFRNISCIIMAFLALSCVMFMVFSAGQAILWHMISTGACLLLDLVVLAVYFKGLPNKIFIIPAFVSSLLPILLGLLV